MHHNIYYLFSVKDRYFTDLTHVLHKKKLVKAFYGLAYARNTILSDPIYKNVSYVSDIVKSTGEVDYIFLEKIEKLYNINISEMLHADRHLSAYDKNKRLFVVQQMIKLFIQEMEKFKITILLPEGIDDFISFFAAVYCEYHKIKYFYPVEVGYAARSCIASSIYPEPEDFSSIFQRTIQLKQENKVDFSDVDQEIKNYINSKKKPSYYLGVNEADYRAFHFKDLKIFTRYIVDYFKDRYSLPHDKSPYLLPFYRLKKVWRKINYKKYIKKCAIKQDKLNRLNYLIYPLHFEPEASTLIQGRWFNDQHKIIEMISKNLPINTLLLVKEHRISIGRRPFNFYKEITKYHNVFLVNDQIDTYHFIENSKGVILISSTMGLEALMLKKPVMAFGERYYNVSRNVYVVENYREINKLIQAMLSHKFDEQDCLALFYTLFSTTKNIGNTCHNDYTSKDIELFSQVVEQKILEMK